MAEAQLSVELTAKIDGLRDNFNAAIKEAGKWDKDTRARLSAIDKGFADLANSVETNTSGRIASSVKRTSTSVSKDLANMANASAKAGQGVAAGSKGAAQALTDLGRIASDAPFGFIGIQNNITPLIESFGRLKAESGSTGTALKSLLGGLVGPAGLGVAFSVVSAGILFYQQYQQRANKTVKEAKDVNKEYAESLDSVDRALLKGGQSAETSLVPLRALYEATQNTSLSLNERRKAVDSLQEQYPAYFKNIKDEAILAGNAEDAYKRLTAAIISKAKATAVEDEIKENAKLQRVIDKRAENNKKATENARKQQEINFAIAAKNQEKLNFLAKQNPITSLSDIKPNPDIRNKGENGQIGDLKTLNDLTAEGVGIQNQKNIAKNEELKLTQELTNIIKANGVESILPDKPGSIPKAAKDIRTLSDVLKDLNIDLLQAANNTTGTFGDQQKDKVNAYQKAIDDLIKLGFDPANDAIVRLKKSQQKLFDTDALGGSLLGKPTDLGLEKLFSNSSDPIEIKPVLKLSPVVVGISDTQKAIEKLELSLSSLVENSLSGGISNAASSVGEALAAGTSVVDALGMSLLESFGGFLSEYGRLLIAYGAAAILKSKLDAAALVPGAGLIAGPAAIAAGIALQIAGSAIGAFASGKGSNNRGDGVQRQQPTAFANGGIIYGPTLGLMGEYAGAKSDPEVVAPLSKLKSILGQSDDSAIVNGTSVINGTSKGSGNIIVQAPAPVVMIPELKVNNRALYLAFKQEEAKQRRI